MIAEAPAPYLIQSFIRLLRLTPEQASLMLDEYARRTDTDAPFNLSQVIKSSKYLSLCWVLMVMLTERPLYLLLGIASVVTLPVSILILLLW